MSARTVLPFTVRRRAWQRYGIAILAGWILGNTVAFAGLCWLFYQALEALL